MKKNYVTNDMSMAAFLLMNGQQLIKIEKQNPYVFEFSDPDNKCEKIQDHDININYDFESEFYLRFIVIDSTGLLEDIGHECNKNKISIDSVLQLKEEKKDRFNVKFALTTEMTSLSNIKNLCKSLNEKCYINGKILFMPIL